MSTISAGTTSTTTLIHSGDTTGSLVLKTNDTGSGGTTAVTIDTSQNVGIGTSSPSARLNIVDATSQDALRITQTGTGNALVVEDSTNPDSTPFVIDANGKVFSGSTAAYSATSGLIPQIASIGNTNGTASMGIGRFSADVSQGYYVFTKSRSTTLGTFGSIVSSGDAIGTLLWTADDGTSAPIQAASITAAVDGTPGTNDMPGRLVFSTTADGASTPTERMRISSTGQITFTAANMLQANPSAFIFNSTGKAAQTGNTVGVISSVSTDATYVGTDIISMYANQGTLTVAPTNQYGFYVPSGFNGATNNYGFYSNIASGTGRWNFYANGTADNYFAGNVGIGTSSPATRLNVSYDVAGNTPYLDAGTTVLITNVNATGSAGIKLKSGATAYPNYITYDVNSGSSAALVFYDRGANAERMRIDSSGNVLVKSAAGLGYGTGSGGTVTQATNKSTAVTLNKPSGRITMNGAALAASTTVEFTFNNSLIGGGDMVVINITGNAATAAAYNIGTRSLTGGSIIVGVRNITAGSLSESLELTFALIKGATA